MEKILLIVADFRLRQLYHEILLTREVEIVPVEDLAAAVLLLTLDYYTGAIFYVEDDDDATVFLKLRRKHDKFSDIKFVLLSSNDDLQSVIQENDLLLSPIKLSIKEVATKIKNFW